jgi:hypothetical protein
MVKLWPVFAILLAVWLARFLVAEYLPDGIVYTSTTTLMGVPLVDIQFPSQKSMGSGRPIANGWIAMGMVGIGRLLGVGVASCGLMAAGVVPIGLVSLGVLAIGVYAVGVVALGWRRRSVGSRVRRPPAVEPGAPAAGQR